MQFCNWEPHQNDGGTTETRSATCRRRISCAHCQLFRHQIKEWRKRERLALGFLLFCSAKFRPSAKWPKNLQQNSLRRQLLQSSLDNKIPSCLKRQTRWPSIQSAMRVCNLRHPGKRRPMAVVVFVDFVWCHCGIAGLHHEILSYGYSLPTCSSPTRGRSYFRYLQKNTMRCRSLLLVYKQGC